MKDTIYRADAIEAVKSTKPIVRSTERNWGKMIAEQHSKELVKALKALQSADVVSREMYEKRTQADERTIDSYRREFSEAASAEAVKVAYICDGRKCDSDCSDCFRTLDIEHAKDFKLMGDTYFQQPSAEAEPTVIRSRTFMPTKDFKEWAKRIRETNPNAVVIPCGAEVVSAEAVQGEWEDKEVFNETDDDHIVDEWQSARCSVCGKYHTTPFMYYFDNFNFCPNCGADMRGEDE